MQGAFSFFSDTSDITSLISSSVPVPPGMAMNACPSSIILALRWGISSVTIRRVSWSHWTSCSTKKRGSTPVTSAPAAKALRARRPISPVSEPP